MSINFNAKFPRKTKVVQKGRMLETTRLATRGVLGVRKLANIVVTKQIGLFQQPVNAPAGIKQVCQAVEPHRRFTGKD